MNSVLQYVLYLVILVVLAIPLGAYMKKVMLGEKTFLQSYSLLVKEWFTRS